MFCLAKADFVFLSVIRQLKLTAINFFGFQFMLQITFIKVKILTFAEKLALIFMINYKA